MKRFAVLAVAAALMLAGCETPYGYMGERPAPKATRTGKARVARSAAPAPQGHPHDNATVRPPAVSGPVAEITEALAGDYMDGQETELRQRLRLRGIRVMRMGDEIVLNLRDDVFFVSNSETLSLPAADIVAALADVLRRFDKTMIAVNGYTDTAGSDVSNLKKSAARAQALANLLIDDGVNPARVHPQGFGETGLKIPTGDSVKEPRNRRIEIRITPHTARG